MIENQRPNHVILTRFNLPSAGHESVVRAQDDWLKNRVKLFEEYCLPSVASQTCRNFRWIIYFDPGSPVWLKQKISGWERAAIHLSPIFRETVSRTELLGDIRSIIGGQCGSLITTNLDNDDGIAVDFVERLQEIPWEGGRVALYLADGLIKCRNKVFRRKDRRNAFCSVRESWDDPVGCWTTAHNRLGEKMVEKIIDGKPTWLQVIHETNVSNRIRGTLCSPRDYHAAFPSLLRDVEEPTVRDFANDLILQMPRRAMREMLRGACKRAVFAAFGSQGLDSAKLIWTHFRKALAL